MKIEKIKTDLLIIGGGTAGCYAAIIASTLGAAKDVADIKILVVEKANIKRSGCLAAGVNALNAYITEGRTPRKTPTESFARICCTAFPRGSTKSPRTWKSWALSF